MCSTACENAINGFTRGVRRGSEDENKATADELATYASAALRVSSEPTANLFCYVAPSAHATDADSPVKTYVRDHLRRSIKKNFEGREYITRPSLLQVMSEDVVCCLFQQHMSEQTPSGLAEELPIGWRQDAVGYIEKEATVLLALCIFVDAPLRSFLKLLEAGTKDSSLPLAGECPTYIENATFVCILNNQWTFLPYDLFGCPGQVAIAEECVIPLIFDEKKDLIGYGGYSDVFRVTIDNGFCSSSMKCKKACIYALKRFKHENPGIERSFGREYSVLHELVKVPHDHILLHVAAWSQNGVFYILFPEARCNLRTFMEEAECPGMNAENIVWFFKQLRGLADAVRHIHALKPLPALFQYRKDRPMAENNQAIFHNDIKPENILVFASEDGSPGIFKISDFGVGTVVLKGPSNPRHTTETFYGTPEYESPDVARNKEASKPNDMWALGCVFLELLDWFTIPTTEKQMSFLSQRYTGPGPSNLAFWYRNGEDKFQLKPQVGRKLMDLEKNFCYRKRALEELLVVIWAMCDVELQDRSTAERVYNDLNYLTRQTMLDVSKDPEYYLRPAGGFGVPKHLWRSVFPTPSFAGRGGIDGDPRAPTTNWYFLNSEICQFKGNKPSCMDQHPTLEPVKPDGPVWPDARPVDSPFVRKLQRLKEASLL